MVLKCNFSYCVYDDENSDNPTGFSVVSYELIEAEPDGKPCPVNVGDKITAVGYYLSKLPKATITLKGEWKKDAKRGLQFAVSECSEEIEKTEFGITNFLSSGIVKGINKGLAARIYKQFGEKTIEIMDSDIDRLIEVPGISTKKLKKIKESYSSVAGSREMISFLGAYKITPKAAQKLVASKISLEQIKMNPYCILAVKGFSFLTADYINIGLGKDYHSPDRIKAAIMHCLRENELCGHCGIEKMRLFGAVKTLLNKTVKDKPVTADEICVQAKVLIDDKRIIPVKGVYYRAEIYWCECDVAKEILRLAENPAKPIEKLPEKLKHWEEENGVQFDEIQEKAVIMALSSGFSVITGGPGRGKTTVGKAIVDLRKEYGDKKTITLMAPTGRAARRLSDSTEDFASTIHSGLQLRDDVEEGETGEIINSEQLLVDETSMVDIWLCRVLLSSVKDGCNVTFVGDVNQLPSVGPGAVLRDLIASGCVPVVKLEKVYRQAEGSTIVTNADRIEEGNTDLVVNDEFKCYRATSGRDAARYMIGLYKQKVQQYGREEVALLSPFHHAKSDASSDSVNKYLQEILNPAEYGKGEVTFRKNVFRIGDIVMQTKNKNEICNGDIGVITNIYMDEGDMMTEVKFDGDSMKYSYSVQELELLELAYCMSYHKAQGAEYRCVIGCLLDEHGRMLKRNLFYTGVTRAKDEYIVIGTPSAMEKAIKTIDSETRVTLLKEKIIYVFTEQARRNPFTAKKAG